MDLICDLQQGIYKLMEDYRTQIRRNQIIGQQELAELREKSKQRKQVASAETLAPPWASSENPLNLSARLTPKEFHADEIHHNTDEEEKKASLVADVPCSPRETNLQLLSGDDSPKSSIGDYGIENSPTDRLLPNSTLEQGEVGAICKVSLKGNSTAQVGGKSTVDVEFSPTKHKSELINFVGITLFNRKVGTQDVFVVENLVFDPGKYEGRLKLWKVLHELDSKVKNLEVKGTLPIIVLLVVVFELVYFSTYNAQDFGRNVSINQFQLKDVTWDADLWGQNMEFGNNRNSFTNIDIVQTNTEIHIVVFEEDKSLWPMLAHLLEADTVEKRKIEDYKECPIIVGNQLPLCASRIEESDGGNKWNFRGDGDSLLLQLKDGVGEDMEVIYIGCLKEEIDVSKQVDVAQTLLENFKCVPAFIIPEFLSKFYHGFCKQYLWPLFHYMLPLSPDLGGKFDRILWQAYVSVNKMFADKVMEVINPDDDYVWVHDYHLMVLPTFLRKRFNRVRLGLFLHSPFPSSEIYRTLPVRVELLWALLNADLIGFHTFDYARHFLSCCSRMLGLSYESKRGYIGIEYYGRTASIKILPVGSHTGQLCSTLELPQTNAKVTELRDRFKDKIVLLGVDDMYIFKGIILKLLAFEQLFTQRPDKRDKVVSVQIANPARGRGKDVLDIQSETCSIVARINHVFGKPGCERVVLIDTSLQSYECIEYYVIAECCLVSAVRDGMNLIPYEYVVRRQGTDVLDQMLDLNPRAPKKSTLVPSEFIGCSPSLSGAIRVNPWNIDAVVESMVSVLVIPEQEKQMCHNKHYKYVSSHDVGYWASSFLLDLEKACQDHIRRRCRGIGFGLGFHVIALDPTFKKLSVEHIVSTYRRSRNRVILLDYDGTMIPQNADDASPSAEAVNILNKLCEDPHNLAFVVSNKTKQILAQWFSSCKNLGIGAEHEYFVRHQNHVDWETCVNIPDFYWKQIVEPVMQLYTETTDVSFIETKGTVLVRNYHLADPDFGSCQANELLDHLKRVLANEPVSVKSGVHIVEVKPRGVSEGLTAERLLASMRQKEILPDLVLSIGDYRSDEDVFEVIMSAKCGFKLSY